MPDSSDPSRPVLESGANPANIDDLFGDDEPSGTTERRPSGVGTPPSRGARHRFNARWLVLGIAALVVIALFWYQSDRQHQRYFLNVEDNTVKVERGLFFPFGASEYLPTDAYESFELPAGVEPAKTGGMSAAEIDQVLLSLFLEISKGELGNLEGGRADVAEDMLFRAQRLGRISRTDNRRVMAMLGDVAFRRGLTEIQGLLQRFDEALAQFQEAARRGGVTFKGADRWSLAIVRLRDEFRELSRESGLDPGAVIPVAPVPAPVPVPVPE